MLGAVALLVVLGIRDPIGIVIAQVIPHTEEQRPPLLVCEHTAAGVHSVGFHLWKRDSSIVELDKDSVHRCDQISSRKLGMPLYESAISPCDFNERGDRRL